MIYKFKRSLKGEREYRQKNRIVRKEQRQWVGGEVSLKI